MLMASRLTVAIDNLKILLSVFLFAVVSSLSGCGQKGPLVLPNKPDTDKNQTESNATQPIKPPSDTDQAQGTQE